MAKGVARSASDDEGFAALGAPLDDQPTRVSTRSHARSILIGAAAAGLRSASVPTRSRSRRSDVVAANANDEVYDVPRARPTEYPVFGATPQTQDDELVATPSKVTKKVLKTLENMTIHTSPLFEPFTVEDGKSSANSSPSSLHEETEEVSSRSSYSVIAPVMVANAQTTEEQLAQMKAMFDELKKDNEEKSKQIAALTKKLEKRPESSKHNDSSEDEVAESDVGENGEKKVGSGSSFTAKDVQEMISNAIKMQFGEPPQGNHRYIKPYTKRIDRLRMPFGYQPPKFQQFDGKGNPKQHIAHFIETCNTAGSEGDILVKQFVRSLKGIAFDWYTDLTAESIDSWDQMESEFLNRFYSTRRIVSMTELTNTKQRKDEPVIEYISRWRALSLECKDRLSEMSAVEMCIQGMNLDLVYILQGIKPKSFQELATRAHDMEITIASHGGRLFPQSESKTERKEFKKADKSFKSSAKESMTVTTSKPVKISARPKSDKRETSSKDAWKTRPTLKELEKKTYPFPDSDLAGMLDDLLEKKVIELPESKRPNEAGRTTDPKYCRYHRVVSHPLEKCITLKEKIMQLAKDGKIILDLDDSAESNCIIAQYDAENGVGKMSPSTKECVRLIQFGSLEPVAVRVVEELPPIPPLSIQVNEDDEEGWTLVTRRRRKKQVHNSPQPLFPRQTKSNRKRSSRKKQRRTVVTQTRMSSTMATKSRQSVSLEQYFPNGYFDGVAVNMVSATVTEDEQEDDDVEETSPQDSIKETKIDAILDALPARMGWQQMFHLPEEMRQQLSIAILHPELYAEKLKGVGEPADKSTKCVACNAALAFTDEDLLLGSKPHNRPLFVSGYIRE